MTVKTFSQRLRIFSYLWELKRLVPLKLTELATAPKRQPVIVEFAYLPDRNRIWRKRAAVPSEEGDQKTKIHADLPKRLRDEINILYRIVRAAANTKDFKSARVRNYAIQLNGNQYTPFHLHC